MRHLILLPLLFVCLSGQVRADMPLKIETQSDLNQVIAQLNKPATKMAALKELIRFASLKVYQVGSVFIRDRNLKQDALEEQAATAVKDQETFFTVKEALDSSDTELVYWGVCCFPMLSPYRKTDKRWLTLLPKIEEQANEGDRMTRRMVYQRLAYAPSEQPLLAERLPQETEPSNILDLIRDTDTALDVAAIQALFLTYFEPLLQYKSKEVRMGALYFIGENDQDAPMYQIRFSDAVYQCVLALTHSSDQEEQKAARFALAELQRQNTPVTKPSGN